MLQTEGMMGDKSVQKKKKETAVKQKEGVIFLSHQRRGGWGELGLHTHTHTQMRFHANNLAMPGG